MFRVPQEDDLPALYGVVGKIAVHWAILEFNLDCSSSLLFEFGGGNEFESQIPLSLKRKLKFLKKVLKKNQALADLTDAATGVYDLILDMSDLRHFVIHGYIASFDPKTKLVTFVKPENKGKELIFDEKEFSIEKLEEEAEKVLLAGTFAIKISQKLMSLFDQNETA